MRRDMLYVIRKSKFEGLDLEALIKKLEEAEIEHEKTEYGVFFHGEDYDKIMYYVKETTNGTVTKDSGK